MANKEQVGPVKFAKIDAASSGANGWPCWMYSKTGGVKGGNSLMGVGK